MSNPVDELLRELRAEKQKWLAEDFPLSNQKYEKICYADELITRRLKDLLNVPLVDARKDVTKPLTCDNCDSLRFDMSKHMSHFSVPVCHALGDKKVGGKGTRHPGCPIP